MRSLMKNIIVIGGLIAIAAAGYYLLVMNRDSSLDTEGEGAATVRTSQTERETQEFLRRLNDLRTIELSDDIFTDPRFRSFTDFTEDVAPVPYGRSNPFSSAQ